MKLNLGCEHLGDDEFVRSFEECRLNPARFHHADHVRLAWIYAGRGEPGEAEERLLAGIRRFAIHSGVPDKFHYTTTVAWARLISNSRKKANGTHTFGEWIASHLEFLNPHLLDNYYSKHKLESEPARNAWVEPDLAILD